MVFPSCTQWIAGNDSVVRTSGNISFLYINISMIRDGIYCHIRTIIDIMNPVLTIIVTNHMQVGGYHRHVYRIHMHVYGSFCLNWCRVRKRPSVITQQMISFVWTQQVWTLDGKVPFMNCRLSTSLMIRSALLDDISRVSCQKGPTRHAYAWQIGPFWLDNLDMKMICDVLTVLTLLILNDINLCYMISI